MWLKRGGITIDEGQQGAKKLRMILKDGDTETDKEQFFGEELFSGQTAGENFTDKAETGGNQLLQVK